MDRYYKQIGPEFLEKVIEKLYDEWIANKNIFEIIEHQPFEDNINKLITEIETLQIGEEDIRVDPQTLYKLGCLSTVNRHYEAALVFFRMAIQTMATQDYMEYIDAFEAVSRLQLYRAQQELSKYELDSAMEKLEESIKAAMNLGPFDKNALNLRGYIFKTMAQVADANRIKFLKKTEKVFRSIIERYPEDESAFNGLGNYYYGLGEFDEAIKFYKEAIRINVEYSAAWHDLALAYDAKMMMDPEQCKDALKAYIEARRLAENELRMAQENPYYAQYLVFSPADIEKISQRIRKLEQECNKSKNVN
jgi:tetratricopeptide (TPR) repeat protein